MRFMTTIYTFGLCASIVIACGRKEISISDTNLADGGQGTVDTSNPSDQTTSTGQTTTQNTSNQHIAFAVSQLDKYFLAASACSHLKPRNPIAFPQESSVLKDYPSTEKPTLSLPMPFLNTTLYTDAKWQFITHVSPPLYRYTFTLLIGELVQVPTTDPQHWHFPYVQRVKYEKDGPQEADLRRLFFLGSIDVGLNGEECSFTLSYKPAGI